MNIRDTVLPVLGPLGDQEDLEEIKDSLFSGWWGKGPKVELFEQKFAELVGSKYAIAVTSNSHGQDLVVKALGLKDVDIINPTMSFITTAIVPLWNNCTSNIVDIDEKTLCLDPEDVKRSLKPDTKMVIAVNMSGIPAPIDVIRSFYDGFILEDCAHSCYTKGAGTKGDVAVWSFQAVKTLPMGDGGMITTNDETLYNKMKDMTWFGIPSTWSRVNSGKYSWDYEVDTLGYKCYMIDLQAALGLSQLKKLSHNLDFRKYVQAEYNERLSSHVKRPFYSDTVQYYIARVPKIIRNQLINYLAHKKIHTSVHFKPLHKHPLLKQNRNYAIADTIWESFITLPCHAGMSKEDVDYVIYWVNKYFSEVYR